MANRWIVDVDGRGLCCVAIEEGGTCSTEFGPAPREQCERKLQRLREGDATRTRKSRVERGFALAKRNRAAREAAATAEPSPAPPQQSPKPSPAKREVVPPNQKNSLDMYAQGFYREPCRNCGKGIERTGARGRAPTIHKGVCP